MESARIYLFFVKIQYEVWQRLTACWVRHLVSGTQPLCFGVTQTTAGTKGPFLAQPFPSQGLLTTDSAALPHPCLLLAHPKASPLGFPGCSVQNTAGTGKGNAARLAFRLH